MAPSGRSPPAWPYMFTVMYVVATGMSARTVLSVGAGVGTLPLLSGFWFFLPRRGRKN